MATIKPIWQTDELSQEWVNQSNSNSNSNSNLSHQHPPTTTTTRHPSHSNSSTTSHSHSQIPIRINHTNHTINSNPLSGSSIVVNQDLPPEPTPPWLKAAVDGMVEDVLGKRPGPLQKIFQQPKKHSPTPTRQRKLPSISPPSNPQIRIRSDHSSSSADASRPVSDGLICKETFDFAVPRSNTSWRSLQHFSASDISSDEPSVSSLVDQGEQLHPEPIPPYYLRRPTRLGEFEVIEEVSEEPSLDYLPPPSEYDESGRDYASGSLPSSIRPPSIPFAHQTPLLNHQRQSSLLSQETSSYHQSQTSNSRKLASSKQHTTPDDQKSSEERIFHFTYDTFARKHLSRLVEEIDGFSSAAVSLVHHTSPKIHVLLGSPGEIASSNVSRSISRGLAHSTPPLASLHAGHTPFRPLASFTQRAREEAAWRESFLKPSAYATESVSGPGHDYPSSSDTDANVNLNSDFNSFEPQRQFPATAPQPEVARSSKRIRLLSTLSLKDSVLVATERHSKRHALPVQVQPIVSKEEPQQPAPRDRLAEARALMERIKAKTTVVAPTPVVAQQSLDDGRFATPRPRNPTPLTASSIPRQWRQEEEEQEQQLEPSQESPVPGSMVEHEEEDEDRDFEWSIDDQPSPADNQRPRALRSSSESVTERESNLNPIHQRLASAAAASLRQALLDSAAGVIPVSNLPRRPSPFGSARSSTTSSSRRHFATQPALPASDAEVLRKPKYHGLPASEPAVRKPKQHGLMTIGPADVEELLLDQQRVGGMVFDATRGKWRRVGSLEKAEEAADDAVDGVREDDDEEEEEEDIFKDIESLNSRLTPGTTTEQSPMVQPPPPPPKSVLKSSPPAPTPVSPIDEEFIGSSSSPSARPNRSVSFQDGRKNGKIVGLDRTEETEETISVSTRTRRIGAALEELMAVGSGGVGGSVVGGENSIVSTRAKKIRPKGRRSSSTGPATISCQSPSLVGTTNTSEEYSFGISREKLLRLITDIEPFEPLWDQLKVISLAGKRLESLLRLDELLPRLDQVDLHANELAFLTGLPTSVRMLLVCENRLTDLASFGHLTNLERLDVSRNGLTSLEQLSGLRHLRELKADENEIRSLEGLAGLDALVKVSLKGNKLKKVRLEGFAWARLEVLNLSRNQIDEISGLDQLQSVYLLNLDHNQFYSLVVLEPMPNLRVLRISDNHLEQVDVSGFTNLRTLYVDQNDLLEIVGAGRLRKLENLSARDQRGGEMSLPMNQIRDVKRLYLGGNPIPSTFPSQRFYNLVYLELAMCQCRALPLDLASVMPNVRSVNLNYNFLTELGPLAGLSRLQKLTVVGSRLKEFGRPLISVLESLPELELLDLRMNPFNAAFYAPLVAEGQGGGPAHMSEYEIIASVPRSSIPGSKVWASMDERFRKALPNEYYLRRTTYRALVIGTNVRLKILDGLIVDEPERKKMGKFLRGLGRKIDQRKASRTTTPDASSATPAELSGIRSAVSELVGAANDRV